MLDSSRPADGASIGGNGAGDGDPSASGSATTGPSLSLETGDPAAPGEPVEAAPVNGGATVGNAASSGNGMISTVGPDPSPGGADSAAAGRSSGADDKAEIPFLLVVDEETEEPDESKAVKHRHTMKLDISQSPRILLQAAAVLAATVVVGVAVFALVRAVAGGSFDGTADEENAQVERDGDDGLQPDGDSSGTRRSSRLGAESNDDDPSGPSALASRPAGAPGADADGSLDPGDADAGGPESDSVDPGSADGPLGNGADPRPGAGEADPVGAEEAIPGGSPGANRTSTSRSGAGPAVSTPSLRPSTTRVSPSTDGGGPATTGRTPPTDPGTTRHVASTRPPTTRPATTKPPTTKPATTKPATTKPPTTKPPTTNPPPVSGFLASPANGSTQTGRNIAFSVERVRGAAQYCWTFSGAGDAVADRCVDKKKFSVKRTSFAPGTLSFSVTARDSSGANLGTQRASVTIGGFSDVLRSPVSGASIKARQAIKYRSTDFAPAGRYCWTLTQKGRQLDQTCSSSKSAKSAKLRDLGAVEGTAAVKGEVFTASGLLIGSTTVNINITK